MTIQKLKFLATTGLLLSFTSIGHAMDAEKDRSLYTKVMKHISKPEVELNLEYLSTLLRTLTKEDTIAWDEVFSPSQDPENKISAIGLAILAGDVKCVEKFLKTKSSANFNYPDTAKQKFASTYGSHLSTEELIQKHLYTSPYMNPNDPVLHIRWANSSHGRTSYSLVHMALDPYFIGERSHNKAPSFLPDFESVLTECRSQVIGALAEGGADFNCRPNAYAIAFRGKEYVDPYIQKGSDFPYIGLHPLAAARFSSSHFFSTTELAAYALFYGADISNIFHLWDGSRDFSEDQNKFMDELFEKAFNHRLEGKISTEKMYFAPSVREKLLTIKENRIRELTDQIKTEAARQALTDEAHVDLDEEVVDMLCSIDNAYKTNADQEKALQKLSYNLAI